MPRVDGKYVRLSLHAWKRIHQRAIPSEAVREAVEHPFSVEIRPGGREIRSVSAPVNGRWAWVSVVLEILDSTRLLVVTVYPRTRHRERLVEA